MESLSGHWGDLTPGAANYDALKQPDEAEVQYLYGAGLALSGVALMVLGSVIAGLLVIVGSVGWGAVMWRRVAMTEHRRAEWQRSMWCKHCSLVFVPKEA